MKNSTGMTLLELVIVIVIVGVLASLALPRMYLMVERARIVEGVGMLMQARSFMERCYLMNNNDIGPCSTGTNLAALSDIMNVSNSHFTLGPVAGVTECIGGDCTAGHNSVGYEITIYRNNHELAVPDPGGRWGCKVLGDSDHSSLNLCTASQDLGEAFIQGFGLYQGYSISRR